MKILDFPQTQQTYEYNCGAKALHAIFVYYGIDIREDEIMRLAETNQKHGTSVEGITQTIKHVGLKYELRENMTINELKFSIDNKTPIIILVQAWNNSGEKDWEDGWESGHFVVVIGYDDEKIYFEDPFVPQKTFLSFNELLRRCHYIPRSC